MLIKTAIDPVIKLLMKPLCSFQYLSRRLAGHASDSKPAPQWRDG
jgi:hypothetical protein